MATVLVDASSM